MVLRNLGAIGLWKQFKENKEQALNNYITALAQGGTRTLPELFRSAGLHFDFSPSVVGNLMSFVHAEMQAFNKRIIQNTTKVVCLFFGLHLFLVLLYGRKENAIIAFQHSY